MTLFVTILGSSVAVVLIAACAWIVGVGLREAMKADI